ncbi:hypothetical protein [Streptomyces sp. NPDC058773]|uniref:hypothetical protein n=1 Tax=Streptomyces sp. NPDC058773 TaxID=3346632 RepID=UPI0036C7EF2F
MSGTTFGRHHPHDTCGSYDTGRPSTPIFPSTSNDPMKHSGNHTHGPGPAGSARPGTPYARPHEAPGTGAAPGAGERREPGEPAELRAQLADVVGGLYATREAQGRSDGAPGAGDRPGTPRGQAVETGQVSGIGDDIAVTDGAVAGAEGVADAGDEAGSHAYGSDGPTDSGFGGGAGNGGGDGPGRSHPTGGDFGGEDDLRRLLHARVGDLEPAPDALEQLRRAVPARRQRRRHAVVGAAAALLLGGTSIPAMVHVAHLAGGSEERPANAAGSPRPQGGTGGAHGEGTEQAGPLPGGRYGEKPGAAEPAGRGKAREKNGAGHGAGGGIVPAPDETMEVTSPVCGREQLGQGTSTVGAADATGRVYGAFRVVNTSAATCSVEGGGTIGLVAQGSTNADRVHVVDHTSGDDATGLPDPATTPDQLVLKPGEAYEVKFAWIPESGGGTTGCATPGPTPTPDASKDPGPSPDGGTTPAGDGGSQAGGTDGSGDGGASGSIVLSHTPEAGEPAAADAKVTDACAGTVYRTEAVAAR